MNPVLLRLFYFSLGISARIGAITLFVSRSKAWMLLVAGVTLMLIKIYFHQIGFSYFHFFGSLAVPCLVVGGINLIPSVKIPQVVASCAFPIYILHYFIASAVMKVVPDFSVAFYPVCIIVVFGVSLGAAIIIKKALPCSSAVLWGAR